MIQSPSMILGKCIKTAKDETSSERPVRKLSRWRGWQNYLRSWMRSWLKIPLSLPSSLWRHKEVIKFGEMGIDLQKERHETRLRLKRALTDTYRGRASKQVVRSQGFERSGENNTITLQWLEYWMERVKVNTSHKTHTIISLDETSFNCWAAMSSVNDLQVSPCQG